jgi:hypothetical protein
MSSLNLQDILPLSQRFPVSLGKIQQFVLLASKLKDDILLVQQTSALAFDPPMILPPTVTTFLQNSCEISEPCVEECWEILKSTIWNDANNLEDSIIADFTAHGHSLGLCAL